MPCFGRRIAEIFIFEIVLSALFTSVIQLIGPTETMYSVFMIICLMANLIYMFTCLQTYLFSIPLEFYFKVNMTAYLPLAVINIIMASFNVEPFYTYIFFPYKLLMQLGLTKIISAFIVNGLFIIEIQLVKIISKRVYI